MEDVLHLQKRNVGSRRELSVGNEGQNPGEVLHKRGIITLTYIDVFITLENFWTSATAHLSLKKTTYINVCLIELNWLKFSIWCCAVQLWLIQQASIISLLVWPEKK